jgi:hypothetical protein
MMRALGPMLMRWLVENPRNEAGTLTASMKSMLHGRKEDWRRHFDFTSMDARIEAFTMDSPRDISSVVQVQFSRLDSTCSCRAAACCVHKTWPNGKALLSGGR